MTPYAYRYIRNRMVFAIILLLLALSAAWLFFPQGKPEVNRVTGTVVEVNRGQAEGRHSGTVTLITARIRLEDGSQTRILINGTPPSVGETVHLNEQVYPNGERRYRLTPAIR